MAALNETIETGFAEVGGARIYYEAAGEGRPVVLVHAGIADLRMWDGQFEALAQGRRVIRYDRRGFGKTAMPAGDFSHRADLRGLLEFLGVGRASFVGCSQGVKIVTDFALEYPERVESLVLVAPALGGFEFGGGPPRQWAELERADAEGDTARVNELELQIWVDGPSRTPDEVDAGVRERVREMNLIALSTPEGLGAEQELERSAAGRLGEIRAPVLVVVGDLDTHKTIAAAEFLSAGVAGARKVSMRGAAHLPNMEQPEEFNRHVLAFLDGQ